MGVVTLRYWAAARSAAGVEADVVKVTEPTSLMTLRERALALHPYAKDLPAVLAVCSVLVDGTPASGEAADALVGAGATVEFLPPFAGG